MHSKEKRVRPLERQSVVDLAVDSIIDFLKKGDLKEGEKLPTEMHMTQSLGISRATLREAYRRLQSLGYISIENGKGAFVRSLDIDLLSDPMSWFQMHGVQVRDYLEVRLHFDPIVACLAAKNRNDKDIEELNNIHKEFLKACEAKENLEIARIDAQFHDRIASSSHNELLEVLVRIINCYCDNLRKESFRLDAHAANAVGPHTEILQAIIDGDEKLASYASYNHMRQAAEDLLEDPDSI